MENIPPDRHNPTDETVAAAVSDVAVRAVLTTLPHESARWPRVLRLIAERLVDAAQEQEQ